MAVDSTPLRFLTMGIVLAWDPVTRVLLVAGQQLCVAPDVPVTGVEVGVKVTTVGHQEADGRRVVTRLTLG